MNQVQISHMNANPSTPCVSFEKGTFGALLTAGEDAPWPRKWRVQVGRASSLGVAASFLRVECQRGCGHKSKVEYVRIGLDFELWHQDQIHVRHVEELFPASILQILEVPLDAGAPERFATACLDFLGTTDADLALFLANPISPMRLYEPALASLIPPRQGTFDDWLAEHLGQLLAGPESGPLMRVEAGKYRACVVVREWRRGVTLRTQGEFKLVGNLRVECPESGAKKGEWSGRAVVVEPCLSTKEVGAPDPEQIARLEGAARTWRARFIKNLQARLEGGKAPILLSDVVPKFDVSAGF